MPTPLPPAEDLTSESFLAWVTENGATELGFPQADPDAIYGPEDPVAPPTWDAYIGQHAVVDQLAVRIASAKATGNAMPATLLTAPAGFGKTTLARLIAAELGRPLVEVERPTSPDRLAEQLAAAEPGPLVLFVDEVHLWKGSAQHDLMTLADKARLVTNRGLVLFPALTLICATTHPEKLIGPLCSRFGAEPRFERYSDDDMEILLAGMAYRAGMEPEQVTREFTEVLAKAAAGSPRAAKHLVLSAVDLDNAGRDCTAASVLAFTGIEADGMSPEHLRYLGALREGGRGAVGVGTIAHLMGTSTERVEQLERLLIDKHYIALTATGRQITPAGHTRLSA